MARRFERCQTTLPNHAVSLIIVCVPGNHRAAQPNALPGRHRDWPNNIHSLEVTVSGIGRRQQASSQVEINIEINNEINNVAAFHAGGRPPGSEFADPNAPSAGPSRPVFDAADPLHPLETRSPGSTRPVTADRGTWTLPNAQSLPRKNLTQNHRTYVVPLSQALDAGPQSPASRATTLVDQRSRTRPAPDPHAPRQSLRFTNLRQNSHHSTRKPLRQTPKFSRTWVIDPFIHETQPLYYRTHSRRVSVAKFRSSATRKTVAAPGLEVRANPS